MSNSQTIRPYAIGFVLSILLTLAAYFAVVGNYFTNNAAIAVIIILALVQFLVQLLFFLHLGSESKPRWNLAGLFSTLSVVLILVLGSLWIMHNLNYHHMSGTEADTFILHEEGIHK